MFYLYDGIFSIKKALICNVSMIVLLMIIFSSSITIENRFSQYQYVCDVINKLPSSDSIFQLTSTIDQNIFSKEITNVNYNTFINELSTGLKIKNISHYYAKDYQFTSNKKRIQINTLIIDDKIQEYFKIDLLSGRYFTHSDFNSSEGNHIPIILGYNYSKFLKLGDNLAIGNRTYNIIGFIKQYCPSPLGNAIYNHDAVDLLDNRALTPMTAELNNISLRDQIFYNSFLIEFKDNASSSYLQNKVKEATNKLSMFNYSYYVNKPKDVRNNFFNEKYNIPYSLTLNIIVLFISTLTFIGCIISELYHNKNDLVIKLSLGASNNQAFTGLIIKFILESFISIILSFIAIRKYSNANVLQALDQDSSVQFDQHNYAVNFSFLTVLVVVALLGLIVVTISHRIILSMEKSHLKETISKDTSFESKDCDLLGEFSVFDNVMLPLIYQRIKPTEREGIVLVALKQLNLMQCIGKLPKNLTSDEKKRTCIARNLVKNKTQKDTNKIRH
ncbi:ABC transporter permease [Clostridium sp. C8-1-8]|uniref:ABC transporter permease n=1 Tax=Clostridium sp. C8-1-8 TaxID=2698831 RepID=UPI00136BA8F0|nr:ABC transporter permease [Clostridium sp. C8-1-8]